MLEQQMNIQINRNAQQLADNASLLTPYQLGQHDAESGLDCVPELYYSHAYDCLSYCLGYEAASGRKTLPGCFYLQLVHDIERDVDAVQSERSI